ncbi:hypothetical protein CDN98_06575 [Roseateles terrae]|nr:hypothetical protein CDN98_06575 [Roseateles terrae]
MGERTAQERRNLVIASAAGLALNAGSAGELLGFSHPSGDPALAKGAFCIAVTYLLIMFLAGFVKDWMHWKTAKTIVDFTIATDEFRNRFTELKNVAQSEPAAIPGVLFVPLQIMNEACDLLDTEQQKAVTSTKHLARFELVRLYLLDFFLPVVLGVTALCRLGEFVPKFIATALS